MNLLATLILLSGLTSQLDADGWTVLAPSPDSRLIHVSSSTGNDANDGLTPATPLRSIRHARTKIRNGFPDWLLLKSGDEFREGLLSWDKGGRSPNEMVVVTSYGDGQRPILKETGFLYYGPNAPAGFSLNSLAIVGLDFRGTYSINSTLAGNSKAVLFSGRMSDILIEGCAFSDHSSSVHLQWQPSQGELNTNVVVRRNTFVDSADMGVLANKIDHITLEENFFDHNGFDADGATVFEHNAYLREMRNATVRGNIFARGSNFGTKLSSDTPGGFTDFVVENNLYFNNGISLDHSAGPSGDIQTTFTHENGIIRDNVFTELGRTFKNGVRQDLVGYLLNSRNIEWSGNLFVHKSEYAFQQILAWGGHHKDITVRDSVIYDWHIPADRPDSYYLETRAAEKVDGYTLSNNAIRMPAATYTDPGRNLGSYNVTLGGADDADAFLSHAAEMHKGNWDARYTAAAFNAYMREGFTPQGVEPEPVPGLEELQRIRADLDALEAILRKR